MLFFYQKNQKHFTNLTIFLKLSQMAGSRKVQVRHIRTRLNGTEVI